MENKYANLSNLAATDHLGRKLPEYGEVPEKREGKTVALFYYLWHGYHGTNGPYDITKILEEDQNAMANIDSPAWPNHENTPMLHWGEPMFGYYISQDEWVLRRHVQMFIDAGVDVLIFDTTNGFTYKKVYLKLFKILREYNQKGFKAPKVAFYLAPQTRGCGTGNMMQLWEDLYEERLYSDLYFMWKGKPLIICHYKRAIPDEIREFFTWRAPTWKDPKSPNTWAWEGNPQRVAVDEQGNPEEIAIDVCTANYSMSDAWWGKPVYGRSWHDGHKDERENASHYGFHFIEQAEKALKEDPPLAFLTQWNEWLVPFITDRTESAPNYGTDYPIILRDEFNEEYSRDLEPMNGGYKDSYYLQMAKFARKFKGLPPPAVSERHFIIDIDGSFAQWDDVYPTYREYTGDTAPRNSRAYDAIGRYENYTGRNEFATLKVAADRENVYFMAECINRISEAVADNHMMLFLKISDSSKPSWEGYNFLINRAVPENGLTSVEVCEENNSYKWKKIADAQIRTENKHLHLCIPRRVLGIGEGDFRLEFKWSDNMQQADVMDFYINGDAAPRGRMNYIFILNENK